MLRHSANQTTWSTTNNDVNRRATTEENGHSNVYDNAKNKAAPFISRILCPILIAISFIFAMTLYDKMMTVKLISNASYYPQYTNTRTPPLPPKSLDSSKTKPTPSLSETSNDSNTKPASSLSKSSDRSLENQAFEKVIDRTNHNKQHCESISLSKDPKTDLLNSNNHTAHLPQFGFLDAARAYQGSDPKKIDEMYPYQCQLPPENECGENTFTVIFMAYNPERLAKLLNEITRMLTDKYYSKLVAEVIIVWNGERHIDETTLGEKLLDIGKNLPLRISYPLKAGFPNDLMNRYHPRLEVKTKAIMYYDDDGPFYSYNAVLGGFELWKRNSNAQIGAMARKLDLGPRQADESKAVSKEPNDNFFVSQCPTDDLHYNFNTFANFDARMVLPSGSFLHSNYLCFIWHPIFENIRKYVRQHPVNPDDGTVSMLVSQLAGRAPKVYSRRIKDDGKVANPEAGKQRRRLMDGIDWDSKGAENKKMKWGRLRSDVANSLARYFGSVNSGSLGWCYGTEHHIVKREEDLCNPEMAKKGMLPWMKKDHSAGDTCP